MLFSKMATRFPIPRTFFFLQYDISTAHFERCSSHPLNQARPVTVMEVILFDL